MISRQEVIVADSAVQYFEATSEEDMLVALSRSTKKFRKFLKRIPKKKIDYAYDEGKWTIREVLQHIIDAEKYLPSGHCGLAGRMFLPYPPLMKTPGQLLQMQLPENGKTSSKSSSQHAQALSFFLNLWMMNN